VIVTSKPEGSAHRNGRLRINVDDLFRDAPTIKSIDELAAPGVFERDAELEQFLAAVRADRDADLA
jgi:hypothetical protein